MKHRRAYIIAIAACLAVAMGLGVAALYYKTRSEYGERYILASNQRSLTQLMSSLSAVDANLQKIRYAGGGPTFAAISAEIWRESELAKQALAALPLSDARLEKCEKFINQAGDYAFSLLRSSFSGGEVSAEQRQALESLAQTAGGLAMQINALMQRQNGSPDYFMSYPSAVSLSAEPKTAAVSGDFSDVESEFPEYATLIYDGPFSEHISSMKPKMLEGKRDITQAQAQKIARDFLGSETAPKFKYEGDGAIAYYSFSSGDSVSIEISRVGGEVVSMCDSRALKTATIDAEQAVEKAKQFLAEKGFESMKTSYYTTFENIVTINFAYVDGDTTCYPDLIKVGVALDDGSVVRYDAKGYIMNHCERELAVPTVALDEAWESISQGLEVVSESTAVIPTPGKNEVLCHEFVCKDSEGRSVIIYINAETGAQENIFLLIESENGTLTI